MAAVFSFDDEDHESFSLNRDERSGSISSNDEHYVPGFAGFSPRSTPKTTAVNTPISQARKSNLSMLDDDLEADRINLNASSSDLSQEYEVELDEDFASVEAADFSRMTMRHQADDFEPLKVLGKGGYGKVMLVKQKSTGKLYAQKQLKKASMVIRAKTVEYTKAERQILEDVRHPFIVKLFYAFQDHHKLYLILEYVEGGELWTHLETEKMFSEQVAAFYIGELVLALNHLHRQGIIYRDLKPENCLLDKDGHLIITDFGISKVAEDGMECKSFCGTAEYMCPEMLLEQPYTAAADWWSLGVLLFELCAGHPPFSGNNKKKIADKILKSKLTLPFYMSADAKDLIGKFLKKVPKVRLGASEGDLAKIKAHRFFRKIDWVSLARRESEPPIKPIITDPVLAENFATEYTTMPLNTPISTGQDQNDGVGIAIQVDGQTSTAASEDVMNFDKFTFVASPAFFKSAFAT
ncbi:protein of unknown function [Taphrina deformans PYCC 5710]|uniref:Serine/threonine-protein kinase psk1 n=1 Tax=Taphrina deformans (strain PYCC 5710 / ATCC 11124 / CBS 356.35 / IMI 108563 / JCM 9778 / NBRC 8474) TaxID=1097556 RepID=R4XEG4_TAPDE|nr:protein of unknown function [Taphrina deformans PYCC 5710]|eukprot:CCG84232.1 protein of unknown function [Taphrina deformans PYCC 5710]